MPNDFSHWVGVRPSHLLVLLAFGGLLSLLQGLPATGEPNTKNVIVLYSFTDRGVFAPVDSLESKLRARVPWPVDFYVDYLESERFEEKGYENSVVETLKHANAGVRLDLVMVVAYPALQFALSHRNELFPGAPIVFNQIAPRRIAGQKMWPGVTGATVDYDLEATVELALRLHPNTNTVVTISRDYGVFSSYWRTVLKAELLRDHSNVKEVDLVGIPSNQLFERLGGLGPQTIVLFGMDPKESIQPSVGALDILGEIGQRLPTYCDIPPEECLSHGGIGVAMYDRDEQASLGAQLAGRVLSGERPENIPVINGSPDKIYVNWRELRRWHLPESALPPDSIILYRPVPLWKQYLKYVIAAVVVIIAQALLIAGLLWQRARKRKAEGVLRESEERFRVMADTTPSLIWMCNPRGRITYLNQRRIAFTGPDLEAGYGDTWAAYVHPDDLKGILDTLLQALKGQRAFSMEYRLRRSDGVYRWMFDVASPRVNGDGSFAGFIGSAIDNTDQKLAQQALEKVSGQLIEAQEKERSRIARDLHDDICQRLALLSMELEQAKRSSDETPAAAKQRLQEIGQHCSEIANDVQSLSHQLHSSRLDYLGIVAAIRGFCKEFAKQHELQIDFKDDGVPTDLPKDVSLCLFRVAQEALHNALKYSGTSQFAVELRGTAEEIQLVVKDAGAGFNVEEARRNRGLGLVSMQERVNLVHGRLFVESKPGAGTTIVVAVPVVGSNGFSADAESVHSASMTKTA